jgi:hypothetical protein
LSAHGVAILAAAPDLAWRNPWPTTSSVSRGNRSPTQGWPSKDADHINASVGSTDPLAYMRAHSGRLFSRRIVMLLRLISGLALPPRSLIPIANHSTRADPNCCVSTS